MHVRYNVETRDVVVVHVTKVGGFVILEVLTLYKYSLFVLFEFSIKNFMCVHPNLAIFINGILLVI